MEALLSLSIGDRPSRRYLLRDQKAVELGGLDDVVSTKIMSKASAEYWYHATKFSSDLFILEGERSDVNTEILTWPEYSNLRLPFAAGCHVIAGGSATGKTTLVRQLQIELSEYEPVFVTYLEPEVDALLLEADLYNALASAMAVRQPVIMVDSFRAFMYSSSSGATGKGGINMALFANLTALDVIVRRLGIALVLTVNFLAADDEQQEFLQQNLIGSTTTSILLPEPGRLRYSSRLMDNRAEQTLTWRRLAAGVVRKPAIASEPNQEDVIYTHVSVNIEREGASRSNGTVGYIR